MKASVIMKKIYMFLLLAALLCISTTGIVHAKDLRFVLVPKVVHPWFDLVNNGANQAAKMLSEQLGNKVVIEYRAPQSADVVEQNSIIERSIATHPDGIIVDLLDEKGNRAVLEDAIAQNIPVIIFDSVAPEGMKLTSIGNDFAEQAAIASERLVKLLDGKGEVAIMMGVPTAPNHAIRAASHEKIFAKYPNIKLVAKGIDNDDIETAQKQAAAIMQANPNLKGWVACDAAGPIGIGQAIKEAGKTGQVLCVGLDNLPDLLALIKEGVVESTSSTLPEMQGYWSVIVAWQAMLKAPLPKYIDTGIGIYDKNNLK